ncbi:MAG TPA: hypothetical protein VLX92_19875 [Kofleriaceae bacterium]|nr:hypothetical protein [Kofleriaceae bacterium]
MRLLVTSTAALLALASVARADSGTDFGPEVRAMFRVAACGNDDPLPPAFPARVIDAHCKEMAGVYASYQKAWADEAEKFIATLRPADLPRVVVYPFGGGDLSSALAVFPDATELTTISLEAAGDIRVIDTINKGRLASDLDEITFDIRRLYHAAHSTTKSLQAASHSTLPGTIMMALAGLAVHGMEPVALRYFDIEPDGSLRYLTNDELDQRAQDIALHKKDPPKKLAHFWYEQDSAFANVEILYRPRGDTKAPLRTYRHILANLDDSHLAADDRVLRHLAAKGKVAVITKAASFLLWYDDFTQIRDYLLGHIAWMISDASGIPPSFAGPAGFEQVTYGDFTGTYFTPEGKDRHGEFVKLWRSQPHRELPFRFGYPDNARHNHMMITRPKS